MEGNWPTLSHLRTHTPERVWNLCPLSQHGWIREGKPLAQGHRASWNLNLADLAKLVLPRVPLPSHDTAPRELRQGAGAWARAPGACTGCEAPQEAGRTEILQPIQGNRDAPTTSPSKPDSGWLSEVQERTVGETEAEQRRDSWVDGRPHLSLLSCSALTEEPGQKRWGKLKVAQVAETHAHLLAGAEVP